ncbi:MAG: PilZ domain-containing protein [Candidatus Acidiferrales bacterium]
MSRALFPSGHMKIVSNPKEISKLVEMPTKERRGSARFPFTAAADVIELQSNARLSARSSDLGLGGCFIDSISPFPVGTGVTLRLTFEHKAFEAQAHVVYAQIGMGMGLAFTSVEPDQLFVLEKWLGNLSGKTPPELVAHEPPEHVQQEAGRAEAGFVLNELIIALMRKQILSESEGKQLLQKLLR